MLHRLDMALAHGAYWQQMGSTGDQLGSMRGQLGSRGCISVNERRFLMVLLHIRGLCGEADTGALPQSFVA